MTLPLQRPVWLERIPPAKRDVRNLRVDFPNLAADMQELRTRIAILERENSRASARLAKELRNGMRADTACCPLLCRQFRIWFVGAALAIHKELAIKGEPYTAWSLDEAVDVGELHTINRKRPHARLRERLNRILGEHAVVFGIAQVEYDRTRNKWQLQYHLMVYGRTAILERTGPEPIVRSTLAAPAQWFSHMCDLSAFGKITEAGGITRGVRLNDKLSCEYFHYLADRSPTSFIFCINCSIVDELVFKHLRDEDDDGYPVREPSWPLPRICLFSGRKRFN